MFHLTLAKQPCEGAAVPPVVLALGRVLAPGLRIAASLALATASAVAGSGGPPAAPVDRAWSAVESLVGTPRCRSDADCRSIGVGARACGGPETYLAWSTQVTDRAALRKAVARHAALRRAADATEGLAAPCVVAEEPAVQCRKADAAQAWGVCVAASVSPGPSGSSTQR